MTRRERGELRLLRIYGFTESEYGDHEREMRERRGVVCNDQRTEPEDEITNREGAEEALFCSVLEFGQVRISPPRPHIRHGRWNL